MAAHKRQAIALATKMAIIEAVESGRAKSEVAKSFNVPKSIKYLNSLIIHRFG